MNIYPQASRAAIAPHRRQAQPRSAAAHGIYKLANIHMGCAVRLVTVQRGIDPREYAVVAFGGAGPIHIVKVAEQFDIPDRDRAALARTWLRRSGCWCPTSSKIAW